MIVALHFVSPGYIPLSSYPSYRFAQHLSALIVTCCSSCPTAHYALLYPCLCCSDCPYPPCCTNCVASFLSCSNTSLSCSCLVPVLQQYVPLFLSCSNTSPCSCVKKTLASRSRARTSNATRHKLSCTETKQRSMKMISTRCVGHAVSASLATVV